MDLESECSAVESLEDNESTQHTVPHDDANKIKDNHVDDCKSKDNGLCGNDDQTQRLSTDHGVVSDDFAADSHANGPVGTVRSMHSHTVPVESPAAPSPPTTKGYGLKKWRRIRRDFVKDPTATVDGCKILKRGLSGSANPTDPEQNASAEIKQNNKPHIGPLNILKNTNVAGGFMNHSPSSDSRFALGVPSAATTDSENSEDRSSKSSTAASMPKARYDLPTVLGYVHGKNRMKNLSGKFVGNSSKNAQQGKGYVESSKKPRGERIKIEKENSQSSVESDSRSSNFGFVLSPVSVTSNGKQSGSSMNHDRRNGDEAHEGEGQSNEEVQTTHRKESSCEIEELSLDGLAANLYWEAKEEKSESHQPSPDQDPLVYSILSLRSVQEALESACPVLCKVQWSDFFLAELYKFGEIGKENASQDDDLVSMKNDHVDSTFADQETSPSDRLASEKMSGSTLGSLETQLFTLTHKVKYLESKLEEARAVLQARDSKISELETSVNGSRSRKEEPGSTAGLRQEKCREMEFDLEGLFQQRMEAEIEFLTLTRAVQKLKVSVGNHQLKVSEYQTSFAREQAWMSNKLGEAENTAAATPMIQARELEKSYGDALGTNNVLMMQRRVFKVTLCFFTQLVLLILVFVWVVLQLSSHSGMVVPT
ncbi:WPP domain-interacting protein 1-like [Gossypium australe]|uniref:WPP domain-interacting protein 1-like n=1 Tax=Gossypium australe TaxID=47621 RepID=A0A5B6VUB1_9ROSI|nr:WPP domain-interacting protein 1-like [Gossypium australe]